MLPKSSAAVNLTIVGLAGCRIDLDLADVGAGREGEVLRVVERRLLQSRLELVDRVLVRHIGGQGDLAERLLLVGALDLVGAVLEHDVGFGRLEKMACDLAALVDHLVQGIDDRGATDRQRARAIGAHAERHLGGVAVDDIDLLHGDAELVGDDLREGRLMALAVAVAAGEHRDASRSG